MRVARQTTRSWLTALALTAALAAPSLATALPSVGAAAPQFTGTTSEGKVVNLSDYAGKFLVLEWTNKDCPFVRKHYSSGNMQLVQAAVAKQGGVWLSVISSAPGKQGHLTPEEADAVAKDEGAVVNGIVLDRTGTIGRLYGASATPQMFVIDEKQTVRYMGAIDDRPSANTSSLDGASNYVLAAVDAIKAGREVAVKETAPYGCSVKY